MIKLILALLLFASCGKEIELVQVNKQFHGVYSLPYSGSITLINMHSISISEYNQLIPILNKNQSFGYMPKISVSNLFPISGVITKTIDLNYTPDTRIIDFSGKVISGIRKTDLRIECFDNRIIVDIAIYSTPSNSAGEKKIVFAHIIEGEK